MAKNLDYQINIIHHNGKEVVSLGFDIPNHIALQVVDFIESAKAGSSFYEEGNFRMWVTASLDKETSFNAEQEHIKRIEGK